MLHVAVLMAAASACNSNGGPPAGAAGSAAAPSFTLEYTRSGGMFAVMDALRVTRDGRAAAMRGQEVASFTLDAEERAALAPLLEALDFEALNAPPEGPQRGGADFVAYTLEYNGQRVELTSLAVPAALEAVIARLDALVAAQFDAEEEDDEAEER